MYTLCSSSQAALMGESIAHVTTWVLPQSRRGARLDRTCLSCTPQQASGVVVSTPVRNTECDRGLIKSQLAFRPVVEPCSCYLILIRVG